MVLYSCIAKMVTFDHAVRDLGPWAIQESQTDKVDDVVLIKSLAARIVSFCPGDADN